MSDVQTRANNGDYQNKLAYPSRGDFDKFYVYNKGTVVENGIVIADPDVRRVKRAEWASKGYTVEVEQDKTTFRAANDAYYAETRRLEKQFRADLEAEYDMVDHPKADLLFKKAWDQGHANGYEEVARVYDDLHELVK